jgi:tetratricopeptide (TPR) repeat protein
MSNGEFNRYQEPYVELAVALILRRHGEHRQVSPMLDRLVRYESFSDSLKTGIERMRQSIDHEREHQTEAANCFERALLANQIAGDNRGIACYLLGELYRRLGRDREAIMWYDKALADTSLPPDVRRWAREQRVWTSPAGH